MMSSNRNVKGIVEVLVLAMFLTLCVVYLGLRGVRLGGDSERYIQGADRIILGLSLEGRQISYPGYIAVVAAAQGLGLGLPGLIGFQILVAVLAAYSLYYLGSILAPPSVGLLAAAMFLLNVEIIRWHTYVLTDSLFISFLVIATQAVYLAGLRASPQRILIALAALAVCVSLRPNGWILLPTAIIYWILLAHPAKSGRWKALVVTFGMLLSPLVPGLFTATVAVDPGGMLRRGVVVWGYDSANLEMPSDKTGATGYWANALGYALRHPFDSIRLAASRVAAELIHVRPFYSARRNSLILAYLLPVYFLAAAALIINRRHPLVWLVGMVICSQLLIVALTFADWDGRFLLYTLPLIQLLAAWSIVHGVNSIQTHIVARHPR